MLDAKAPVPWRSNHEQKGSQFAAFRPEHLENVRKLDIFPAIDR
jgi:hypothetical protein